MNIKDYAKDVNLSVAEVLRKCDELGIKADGNSILSEILYVSPVFIDTAFTELPFKSIVDKFVF